jgi:hypothetical protein
MPAYPRRNRLIRALQEYGGLVKTVFILRYLESEDYGLPWPEVLPFVPEGRVCFGSGACGAMVVADTDRP